MSKQDHGGGRWCDTCHDSYRGRTEFHAKVCVPYDDTTQEEYAYKENYEELFTFPAESSARYEMNQIL